MLQDDIDDELTVKDSAIEDEYSILWDVSLGTGINGHVVLCVHRKNRRSYALKCLKASNPKSLSEIKLQWACRQCKGVVKTFDVFLNNFKSPNDRKPATLQYLVVMELMQEELFDRIMAKRKFTEVEASELVRDMAEILVYMHDRDIAHRDLKPENFLYTEKGGGDLKLADFGFAKVDNGNLTTPVFTPYYVPKEILLAKQYKEQKNKGMLEKTHYFTYTKACDMWSLGIIVYIMLCGFPPFQSEIAGQQLSERMKAKIIAGKFDFHPAHWKDISKAAKGVVSALLTADASCRMTAKELLNDPWVQGKVDVGKGISLDRRSLRQTSLKMKGSKKKKDEGTTDSNVKLQSDEEVVKNLRQNSIRGKKSTKSAHEQRVAVARAKSIKKTKKPNTTNTVNQNDTANTSTANEVKDDEAATNKNQANNHKVVSSHKVAFTSSIMMEQLINNWKRDVNKDQMLEQLEALLETIEQDRNYLADVHSNIQSEKDNSSASRLMATELENRFTVNPTLKLTPVPDSDLHKSKRGGSRPHTPHESAGSKDTSPQRLVSPGGSIISPKKNRRGWFPKRGLSSTSLAVDETKKVAMTAKNISTLNRQANITDAFGVVLSAQKAVWYGSALLEKVDSAEVIRSARRTADNLIQTCRGPLKVILAVSLRAIGAVDAKHKTVSQIESTSMIHRALVHASDPFFFAYITQNAMLPFQHMHVFRLKHQNQLEPLLETLPSASTQQPEDLSNVVEPSDKSSFRKIIAVRYLGAAPVSARAWWASHKVNIDDTNSNIEKLTALAADILCRPLNGMWGDFNTRAHLQDTGLTVTPDDVTIVDALNPDPRKIPTVNIKNVCMLDIPESAGRNGSSDKTNINDAKYTLSREMRMTAEQREEVMVKVTSGEMTVDEATSFVLNMEASLAEKATEKLVCFTHKDDTLNTVHIEIMLCTRADTATELHKAITRSCDRISRRSSKDPFRAISSSSDESPCPDHELSRDLLDPIQFLGNGEFGDVYLANQEMEDGSELQRAVKTLKSNKGKAAGAAFVDEARIHLKLKHQNVVECVGVVLTGTPCLVVLEYLLYGDLKKVFVAFREKEIDVTPSECAWILYQLADAMAYITSQRIVHMDFALRNCLLGTNSTVKLADFGIAHHYDDNLNGYRLRGKLKIPFLHAPPETLPEKMWTGDKDAVYTPLFNETTDIWSFGVLTWEILSYGQHPYGRVPGVTMLTNLKRIFTGELRLQFEPTWSKSLVETAKQCFLEPSARPTFVQVRDGLHAVLQQAQEGVRDLGKLLNDSLETATLSRAAMASKMRKSIKGPTRKLTQLSDESVESTKQESTLVTRNLTARKDEDDVDAHGGDGKESSPKTTPTTTTSATPPPPTTTTTTPTTTTINVEDSAIEFVPSSATSSPEKSVEGELEFITQETDGFIDDGAEWTSLPVNLRLNIDNPEASIPSPNRLSQIPKGHFVYPSVKKTRKDEKWDSDKGSLTTAPAPMVVNSPQKSKLRHTVVTAGDISESDDDDDDDDDFAGFTPRTTEVIEFDIRHQNSIM